MGGNKVCSWKLESLESFDSSVNQLFREIDWVVRELSQLGAFCFIICTVSGIYMSNSINVILSNTARNLHLSANQSAPLLISISRLGLKPRLHEQFSCDNFYVTTICDRVDDTAIICWQFVFMRQKWLWTADIRNKTRRGNWAQNGVRRDIAEYTVYTYKVYSVYIYRIYCIYCIHIQNILHEYIVYIPHLYIYTIYTIYIYTLYSVYSIHVYSQISSKDEVSILQSIFYSAEYILYIV